MKRVILALVVFFLLGLAGCAANDGMVGLWVFSVADANPPGIHTRIDLREDGTGSFTNSFYGEETSQEITWTAEDGRLCITRVSSEEPDCTAYDLDGDELTLDIPDEGPLVFIRQPGD